tara:strand:+ start:1986 stop:2333 length:348 start_codon:yes stop_codon:yes gene_type:complete
VKTKEAEENKWIKLQKEHPALPKGDWNEEQKTKQPLITKDNINPDHYKSNGIECIDAMVAAFGRAQVVKWAEVNAFKYIFRLKRKGYRQDNIKKAIWMLEFALGKDPRNKGNDDA